jgi:hypothetical protein
MSHGKRYSAKERKEILEYLGNHTYQETMDKFGVSQMSLARWVKNKKKRDTNTSSALLTAEIRNEVQLYLKLLEKSELIQASAIVTASGEVIMPETTGFQQIFLREEELAVIISNFLLCAQGFTSAVMNHQKLKDTKFDDLSIQTPLGYFSIKGVGQAVLVILIQSEINLYSFYTQYSAFLNQIQISLKDILD